MSRLRNSILANYAGQAWATLMAVAFVPFYIRSLGIEAFGLVGFMLSLQAVSQLFDFGMGGTLNRELAKRAHDPRTQGGARDLVRTFEWLVWPLSILIGIAVWQSSAFIAGSWLHPQRMTGAETANAVSIMGLAVASMWPTTFYANGLSGLERQTTLNIVTAVFATLRGAGVLLVLWFLSPTIEAFFGWYAAVGVCHSLVCAVIFWRALPRADHSPRFRSDELRGTQRFAGGLFAITALSLGLTQVDRLALSALRPLEELGYYGIAISVAAGLGRMVQPMFNALYPRFSRLVADENLAGVSTLYHLSSQYLAVVVASVTMVLVAFGADVLYLWTGDHNLVARVVLPMNLLVAGSALNGLMNLPYALQLANGWTRLTIAANTLALAAAFPWAIWAVSRHGVNGAASIWLLVNLIMLVFALPRMHRQLLPGELRRWCLQDILPPMVVAAAVATAARQLIPVLSRDGAGLALLLAASAATLLATAAATPATRDLGRRWLASRPQP
jgi:O-antigen/teichoic acid export membrane protein